MNVAFFTEMGFRGKVPRNHPNMRTEFAWMVATNADHYNINDVDSLTQKYDLGIVILPKNNPNFNLSHINRYCSKVGIMQEGPHWYFQDYPLDKQIEYYNTLSDADIIFVHNQLDRKYYNGLLNHPDVRVMRTLMIEDPIGDLTLKTDRQQVIIGGNFVSWYGGFDSYIVASEIASQVYAPSMGRKVLNEESLVQHLPYMQWTQWMHALNTFKIGVHLMRTHAAGTFALNCAYLGIPCIGYEGLDTQQQCHSHTTVAIGDVQHAKDIINRLDQDQDFYNMCSEQARQNYNKFHESVFTISA